MPHGETDWRGRPHEERRFFRVVDAASSIFWHVVAASHIDALWYAAMDASRSGTTDEISELTIEKEYTTEEAEEVTVLDERRGDQRYPLASYWFGPVAFSEY
jgi:hypothetical protein